MARIITITSGQSGAGKTSISLNLSLSLASKGFKVCLFDADTSLSNFTVFTGLHPEKNLEPVISGQLGLNDIIIKNYQGIDIIPAGSGIRKLSSLNQKQADTLVKAFLALSDYDYFILDTSCDMTYPVLSFCMASHAVILVATCETESITSSYSLLKLLSTHQYHLPVRVVINQAISGREAKKAYDQLTDLTAKFLPITIKPLGIVAKDNHVKAAIVSQKPFVTLFPDTIASKCLFSITQKLTDKKNTIPVMPLELFWDKCLTFIKDHKPPQKKPVPRKVIIKRKKETGPDINKALFHIESRLSTLIKEVNGIKKSLETPRPVPTTIKAKPVAPPEPKEISLDFESWLKKKYK